MGFLPVLFGKRQTIANFGSLPVVLSLVLSEPQGDSRGFLTEAAPAASALRLTAIGRSILGRGTSCGC